ncbi:hypothetical protein HMPREF9624_00238 [Oribacterium asaccharolyticum ACB7]|uniref:Uncharacterized protein n=1 Tax=Oribacterium asaccharolyticum ACB7 TaxID=796944 RepID=G9WTK4_9FIRM|nr:hypothetical protein HMPREF9624_00238 [Oribacterium asaccharolyticum ACB7]
MHPIIGVSAVEFLVFNQYQEVSVTKEQLKKYSREKSSIKLLTDELEQMCGETVHDYGYDYTKGFKHIIHLEGFNQKLYNQRLARLSEIKKRVEKTERWIESLEDDRLRFVIRSRYSEDRSWKWIAKKLSSVSEDYVRIMIHDKYFERNKNNSENSVYSENSDYNNNGEVD